MKKIISIFLTITLIMSLFTSFATVSFASGSYAVDFSAGANGALEVTADGVAISTGDTVASDAEIILTATPDASYEIESWSIKTKATDEKIDSRAGWRSSQCISYSSSRYAIDGNSGACFEYFPDDTSVNYVLVELPEEEVLSKISTTKYQSDVADTGSHAAKGIDDYKLYAFDEETWESFGFPQFPLCTESAVSLGKDVIESTLSNDALVSEGSLDPDSRSEQFMVFDEPKATKGFIIEIPSSCYTLNWGSMVTIDEIYAYRSLVASEDVDYEIIDTNTIKIAEELISDIEITVTFSEVIVPGYYEVNYSAGANGSILADFNSGELIYEGDTLTFTATPDAGYEVDSWSAKIGDEDEIKITDRSDWGMSNDNINAAGHATNLVDGNTSTTYGGWPTDHNGTNDKGTSDFILIELPEEEMLTKLSSINGPGGVGIIGYKVYAYDAQSWADVEFTSHQTAATFTLPKMSDTTKHTARVTSIVDDLDPSKMVSSGTLDKTLKTEQFMEFDEPTLTKGIILELPAAGYNWAELQIGEIYAYKSAAIAGEVTKDYTSETFTITAARNDAINVEVTFKPLVGMANVTYDLEYVRIVDAPMQATKGQDLTLEVLAYTGGTITDDIVVKSGSFTLEEGIDYIYDISGDRSSATLTVYVAGDIEISLRGIAPIVNYTYDVMNDTTLTVDVIDEEITTVVVNNVTLATDKYTKNGTELIISEEALRSNADLFTLSYVNIEITYANGEMLFVKLNLPNDNWDAVENVDSSAFKGYEIIPEGWLVRYNSVADGFSVANTLAGIGSWQSKADVNGDKPYYIDIDFGSSTEFSGIILSGLTSGADVTIKGSNNKTTWNDISDALEVFAGNNTYRYVRIIIENDGDVAEIEKITFTKPLISGGVSGTIAEAGVDNDERIDLTVPATSALIYIDGEELDASNYRAAGYSITLKGSYLMTLPVGSYEYIAVINGEVAFFEITVFEGMTYPGDELTPSDVYIADIELEPEMTGYEEDADGNQIPVYSNTKFTATVERLFDTTALTDKKMTTTEVLYAGEFIVYEFDNALTYFSGVRTYDYPFSTGEERLTDGELYASVDGVTWYKLTNLIGEDSEIIETALGYNVSVKYIAIKVNADYQGSELHIIGAKNGNATMSLESIATLDVYDNETEASAWETWASTGAENPTGLIDGIYDVVGWQSDTVWSEILGGFEFWEELPYEIEINFNETLGVSGVRYTPRMNYAEVSAWNIVQIYGQSEDGNYYYITTETIPWTDDIQAKQHTFDFGKNYNLRGVKFKITGSWHSKYASANEIEFYRAKPGYAYASTVDEIVVDNAWEEVADGAKLDFGTTLPISGIKYLGSEAVDAEILVTYDGATYYHAGNTTFDDGNDSYSFYSTYEVTGVKVIGAGVTTDNFRVLASDWDFGVIDLRDELDVVVTSDAPEAVNGNLDDVYYNADPMTSIAIDFGARTEIAGFNYYPRRDGERAGDIKKFDIYGSIDNGTTWELLEQDVVFEYGKDGEVQQYVFDKNYTLTDIKIASKIGKENNFSIAEIKFLDASVGKAPVSANLVDSDVVFNTTTPANLDVDIYLNDAKMIYDLKCEGDVVADNYYAITDNGITISKYFFIDNGLMEEKEVDFSISFLRGEDAEFTVRLNYEVQAENGANGTISIVRNGETIDNGDLVAKTDEVEFIATPAPGYEVDSWTVEPIGVTDIKITDRSNWGMAQDAWGLSSVAVRAADGNISTYYGGWVQNHSSADSGSSAFVLITLPEEMYVSKISSLKDPAGGAGIIDYKVYAYDEATWSGFTFPNHGTGANITFPTVVNGITSQTESSVSINGILNILDDNAIVAEGTLNKYATTEQFMEFDEPKLTKGIVLEIPSTSDYAWAELRVAEIYAYEAIIMDGSVTEEGSNHETFMVDEFLTDVKVSVTFKPIEAGEATATYNLTNVEGEVAPATITMGENAVITLAAAEGYGLPTEVTVTMGELTLVAGTDYTYVVDGDEATLTIYNVSADFVVTAQGVLENAYSVTYVDNNGATGTAPATDMVVAGASYTVKSTNMKLTGKVFKNWTYNNGVEDVVVSAGATITMPEMDIVMSANWENAPKEAPRGGGGSEEPGETFVVIIDGEKFAYEEGLILKAPTKEGYEFIGWFIDKELTIPYANEGISKDIELYTAYRKVRSESDLTDIEEHWAYKDITKLYVGYVINGRTETTFVPDANITRAEFVQILYKLSGQTTDGGHEFSDVSFLDWYSNAIAWAVEAGITNGVSDNTFAPNDNITREQMATMLYRFAKLMGIFEDKTNKKVFTDADQIADYAKAQVDWAQAKKIVNGYEDGSFAPKSNATRAEAVTMISRLIK